LTCFSKTQNPLKSFIPYREINKIFLYGVYKVNSWKVKIISKKHSSFKRKEVLYKVSFELKTSHFRSSLIWVYYKIIFWVIKD